MDNWLYRQKCVSLSLKQWIAVLALLEINNKEVIQKDIEEQLFDK